MDISKRAERNPFADSVREGRRAQVMSALRDTEQVARGGFEAICRLRFRLGEEQQRIGRDKRAKARQRAKGQMGGSRGAVLQCRAGGCDLESVASSDR